MFTDMVGYTALSEKNEAQTLQLLEEHRRLIRPFFPRHNGREIKTLGDSFLVEFPSALEAVRCAFDIQQSLHELNFDRPAERKVLLRIGVHLGDVIHRENDVYGDAVNVASRIEPLATTGGVCVTVQVYDQIRNKFEFPLLSIGKTELKNLVEKVEVYRVVLPWEVGSGSERRLDSQRIAVLPLLNISPDPNDEYFADGLTEELITKLSGVPGLKVIARTSIMNYKRKEKSVRDIAKELEVSSIIEGSVRKAGNRMRVTVQLVNARNEEHLWAAEYDRTIDDIFAIQTEIAEKVAGALTIRTATEPKNEHASDALVYTMFMRANQLLHGSESLAESNLREALSLFTQVVERTPSFSRAYAGIARTWFSLGNMGFEDFSMVSEKGRPAAVKAIEAGPNEAEAHLAMGLILMAEDEFDSVRTELQQAIQLNSNLAEAHNLLGQVQMNLDGPNAAIKSFETSLDLDPLSLDSAPALVLAYYASGKRADALKVLQRMSQLYPRSPWPEISLARYYLWNEDYVRAQEHIDKISHLEKGDPAVERNKASVQGVLHALTGNRREAERFIRYFEGLNNESARLMGVFPIASALGNIDDAFKCLMRMGDLGAWWIGVKYIPYYAPLRKDPRFEEFCKNVGIPPS